MKLNTASPAGSVRIIAQRRKENKVAKYLYMDLAKLIIGKYLCKKYC